MNKHFKWLISLIAVMALVYSVLCTLRLSRLTEQINRNWEHQIEYDNRIYKILKEIAPEQSEDLPLVGASIEGTEQAK